MAHSTLTSHRSTIMSTKRAIAACTAAAVRGAMNDTETDVVDDDLAGGVDDDGAIPTGVCVCVCACAHAYTCVRKH